MGAPARHVGSRASRAALLYSIRLSLRYNTGSGKPSNKFSSRPITSLFRMDPLILHNYTEFRLIRQVGEANFKNQKIYPSIFKMDEV